MKRIQSFLVVFAVLISVANLSAQNIYLYYPGITNGKGIEPHRDEVRLTSVAGGMHRESTYSTTMPIFSPYTLTKSYDGSSPLIMSDLAEGAGGDEAEIRFYTAGKGGKDELVLTIALKGTTIMSYEAAGVAESTCNNCPVLSETFSIDFERIKIGTFEWDRNQVR